MKPLLLALLLSISAALAVPPAAVIGKYLNADKPGDYVELRADGKFTIKDGDINLSGSYNVYGPQVAMSIPKPNGEEGFTTFVARLEDGKLFDPAGQAWTLSTGAPEKKAPAKPDASSGANPAPMPGGKAQIPVSINHLRQLVTACKVWAADNNGAYPTDLEQLFKDGIFTPDAHKYLHCPLLGDDTQPGYDYFGTKLTDSSPANKIIFMSKWKSPEGKRIVAHNDASVQLEVPKEQDLVK